MILESPDFTIKANLIKNVLKIYNKKNDKVKIKKFKKINTYYEMHKKILNKDYTNLCNYQNAKNLMLLIKTIRSFKKN